MADNENADGGGNEQQNAPPQRTFMTYLGENKLEALLLITRIATVIFSLLFIFPFAGHPISYYQKALLSNAATSALRLHQRVPHFAVSREYLTALFTEDSCHYLIYSLIFFMSFPITFALMPVVLYAVLHSSSFITRVYQVIGQQDAYLAVRLGGLVQQYQVTVLRIIATTEIFLFPTILISIFGGQMSILMPFVYYRFLTFRYTSRRNPYSRQMFYELRLSTEQLASHPRCPAFIGGMFHKMIALVCRLAPVAQAAEPAAGQQQ